MTTFNRISENEIRKDAPLSSKLFKKLRDNVLAIQEGDSSAPQIKLRTNNSLPDLSAGNNVKIMAQNLFTHTDASLLSGESDLLKFKFNVDASYKVTIMLYVDHATGVSGSQEVTVSAKDNGSSFSTLSKSITGSTGGWASIGTVSSRAFHKDDVFTVDVSYNNTSIKVRRFIMVAFSADDHYGMMTRFKTVDNFAAPSDSDWQTSDNREEVYRLFNAQALSVYGTWEIMGR